MPDYPPNMTLRPLEQWPRDEPTTTRPRSPFSAGWSDTIGILMTELRQLGPNPRGPAWSRASFPPSVLQVAIREKDFRISDGMPRANAVPTHPGVILNIESRLGPLSYPCDKFDRWQDNLRAIALGLRALRSVDRYGITPGNEQYRGWQAIEAKPAVDATAAACALLAAVAWPNERPEYRDEWAPKIARDWRIGRNTARKALANAHPDRHDGDRTLYDQVEQAVRLLELRP
ncbi:molecular chaperone DnaJ [Mycobacterium sp. NPDC050041]|uniref:molecular chaperone DnaJ n=1 Tax=Mycobacterium sp. NPDC050041 TaxID=3364293 RepID=UPI003C306BCF